VIEAEDRAPTVEQVVAYERFWKLVVERLMRERESRKAVKGHRKVEKIAASISPNFTPTPTNGLKFVGRTKYGVYIWDKY
jgi:hypothetical protein